MTTTSHAEILYFIKTLILSALFTTSHEALKRHHRVSAMEVAT